MGAEDRVAQLHLILPPAPKPLATYNTAVRIGDLVYLSGHLPVNTDGTLHVGKLGAGLMIDAGRAAARQTGLAILATLRDHLGSLDKVARLVKTFGMVNCSADFVDQPQVVNGFSDLMIEVFGELGRGARSAVGVASLPRNAAVEIEAIFLVKD